jgi:hypothetical protein
MIRRLIPLAIAAFLLVAAFGGASAHYVPKSADGFSYSESIAVLNGQGTYYDYTEVTAINGSIDVTSVLPNGTASATYYNADLYENSTGAHQRWTSSGRFSFSSVSFQYVNGTDNQTGYSNPYVWFFMNNSLGNGGTFELLNTHFAVLSTAYDYDLDTAAGGYVTAIYAEGSGTYERNDAYGVFSATYNWKAYFDPGTGYILGYLYTEQDSNPNGTSFTLVDSLSVTQTSYTLTPGTAPASSSGNSSADLWLTLGVILAVVVVIVVVIVVLAARSRRRHPLPKHSASGQVSYVPPPPGPPPPGIHLTPSGQPAVQQIVIKETVKVNCRFCGALIDSTVDKCPFCGAPRS